MNTRIKKCLKTYHLKQWELAKLLDIGETTLCRRLREELPEEEQEKIVSIIKESRGVSNDE